MLHRLFVAALALSAALPAVAQTLAPFSAERAWQIQRIGNPTITPDGKTIVAPVTRYDMKENKGLTDLWLWSADGSVQRALTTNPASDSSPVVSPDGQSILFVSQRNGDTAAQLYLMSLAGGEPARLTNVPTGVAQPKWFPDSKRVAFLSRVWTDLDTMEKQATRQKERADAKSTAQAWDGGPIYFWDTWLDDRQLHVMSVGVEGGEPASLTAGTGFELPRTAVQLETPLYDISPDGRELAFVADSNPAANVTNLDVFTLPIGGKQATNHTASNAASDGAPLYSPDGRWLAWGQQRIRGFYGDLRRLMLLDRRSGAVREVVGDEWDRSAEGLAWAPNSKHLYGTIEDAGSVRVYEIPLQGKPRVITGDETFSSLAVAAQAGTVVGLRQTFIEPPTLVRIDPKAKKVTKLSTVNDALLAGTALGTYESVTYPGANGKPIQMWVNYPPGFDRSKKYPLFMLIHGGPHNAIPNAMQFRWNAQVFGSWGYVTGWPNFHGSSGFGNAFTDSINPQQDALPYKDVIAAADWFAQQPWIDSGRMVAGGGSYGGYLTSIILGRPHPFKALVAHAAVYNWYTQVGADYAFEEQRFGGFWTPEQQAVFKEASPHYGAANFSTPTLIVHGQKDYRVPVNHGIELYQALLQKGVPARLLYFGDENHWVLKPGNSLVWYREVKDWLDRYTQPASSKASDAPQPPAASPSAAAPR
jgi:dipeptidyl aminopeptidase/acylaminoacyl peptidase